MSKTYKDGEDFRQRPKNEPYKRDKKRNPYDLYEEYEEEFEDEDPSWDEHKEHN